MRGEQGVPVLGHEQEDQAVDQPQDLAVEVLAVQCPTLQPSPEAAVPRVSQEPRAEALDGGLDAVSELVEGAYAVASTGLGPALEPAFLGDLGLDAAAVTHEPQQQEVAVLLAVHDGLQVELQVGLSGEAVVVAEDPETQAVADKAPQVVVGTVEEVLYEPVRGRPRSAGHTLLAAIQVDAGAEQVDRRAVPGVRDGEGLAVDLCGGRPDEAAVTELPEKRKEPAIPGNAGRGETGGFLGQGVPEFSPAGGQLVPGAVGRLSDPLVGTAGGLEKTRYSGSSTVGGARLAVGLPAPSTSLVSPHDRLTPT